VKSTRNVVQPKSGAGAAFPFPSLDFSGRVTLTVLEVAAKLGWTAKHVADLIVEGQLGALDGKGKSAYRSSYRIPIEDYREFIVSRMTGPRPYELFTSLSRARLSEIARELNDFLKTTETAHE